MTLEVDSNGSYRHLDDPGEPTTGDPRLSVTDEEAAILSVLAHGRTVVEFGTGLGVSTRALAQTAQLVCTVDVDEWVQDTIWPDLPVNVVCHVDRSELPTQADMVFIDGDHTLEGTQADVRDAMYLATQLVVMHDIGSDVVRSCCGPDWLFIPTTHGLGVLWR